MSLLSGTVAVYCIYVAQAEPSGGCSRCVPHPKILREIDLLAPVAVHGLEHVHRLRAKVGLFQGFRQLIRFNLAAPIPVGVVKHLLQLQHFFLVVFGLEFGLGQGPLFLAREAMEKKKSKDGGL